MLLTAHQTCVVDGCGKPTQGRMYCHKHMIEVKKGKRAKIEMSSELKALIRSACCQASCTVGVQHEYGTQYCSACGNPCLWKPPM